MSIEPTDIKRKLATDGKAVLSIKVVPNSSRTGFLGVMADGTVKIGLLSAPEKGKANEELVGFIADQLRPMRVNVKILSGSSGRRKKIMISQIL